MANVDVVAVSRFFYNNLAIIEITVIANGRSTKATRMRLASVFMMCNITTLIDKMKLFLTIAKEKEPWD